MIFTEALEGHLLLITYCLLFMTYNLLLISYYLFALFESLRLYEKHVSIVVYQQT